MITDARGLADGSTLEADVCIVGGGPAGITTALALGAGGRSVVLVESGGFVEEVANQALSAGDVIGEPIRDYFSIKTLQETRARVLGGNTSRWGGYCRPHSPIDFEPRPYQPVGGWPFDRDDIDPWYALAHDVCQLGPYNFDPEWWATTYGTPGPVDTGSAVDTGLILRNSTRFGSAYRPQLQASPSITVLTYANGTDLVADASGSRVDHLTVRTLSGVQLTVRSAAYTVATGAIEVARLLLASNSVVPAGLGNEHDLVGRYFADHSQVVATFSAMSLTPDALALYAAQLSPSTLQPTDLDPNNQVLLQGVFELSESVRRSEGLPNLHLEMVVDSNAYPPDQPDGIGADEIMELMRAGGRPAQSVMGANVLFESVLNRDSRVRIDPTQIDALGLPRVQLDHHRLPQDLVHLARGIEILGETFGQLGLGRLQNAAGWVTPLQMPTDTHVLPSLHIAPVGNTPADVLLGTSYHHMCTARMDVDPTAGVVDPNCRVHSVDNLYIGGSAAFPTGAGSYPTYLIVAMALRLADHLQQAVLP